MAENLHAGEVHLTDEEVDEINNLAGGTPVRLIDSFPPLWFDNVIPGKRTINGWTVQEFGWEDEEGNWLI